MSATASQPVYKVSIDQLRERWPFLTDETIQLIELERAGRTGTASGRITMQGSRGICNKVEDSMRAMIFREAPNMKVSFERVRNGFFSTMIFVKWEGPINEAVNLNIWADTCMKGFR